MVTCPLCDGDGNSILESPLEGGDRPCPVCLGHGEFSEIHGNIRGVEVVALELLRIIRIIQNESGVFNSYIIIEELDATEHNALTDTQKDGVLHLLACGKVDLNTGKAGRVRLWNWFGEESTTVANLTALLE